MATVERTWNCLGTSYFLSGVVSLLHKNFFFFLCLLVLGLLLFLAKPGGRPRILYLKKLEQILVKIKSACECGTSFAVSLFSGTLRQSIGGLLKREASHHRTMGRCFASTGQLLHLL